MDNKKELLLKQLEEVKQYIADNPDCEISVEELEASIESVSTAEGIELLSRFMKAVSGTPQKKMSTEKTTITAEVLKDTADKLNSVAEISGTPVGEQIDRMGFYIHPYDPALAAQLICEDLIAHTINLSEDQFDLAIYLVLSMMEKGLGMDSENNRKAFKDLVEKARKVLDNKGIELPEDDVCNC